LNDRETSDVLTRSSLLADEYSADIDLEQGALETALPLFESTHLRALASCPDGELLPELAVRIVECKLQLQIGTNHEREIRRAIEQIKERGELYILASMQRVLALTLAASGNNSGASIAFEEGFALFDEIGTPYEWAKLWMAYGDWLSSEGAAAYRNDSAAVEAYRAAMDHFERIGSEFKLGEARQRLEALEARMTNENEPYAATTAKVRPARRPRQSAELLRRSQWAFDSFGTVTRSAHLLTMLEEVASVAVSDMPVLILGESGTGKELVARAVHTLSGRTGEFVAINCSAVPEAMLEGEFFGYMRGAFTNAIADKPGLLEIAHDGTLFLDEIGEMSVDLQSKLLRFLETGSLRRVGATRDTTVDTRIVAATNRERSGLQGGDGFRSDLYYRLAHAVYELPPLRERGDDVELLLDHFLEHFSRQNDRVVRLTPAVRSRLIAHGWPGNVRELRSAVNKLVVSARPDGVVTPRELPPLEAASSPASYTDERDAGEKKRILRALDQAHFVKTDAARTLRISRTTLVGKMKRLGIEG
jgi:two-component system response regulator AtoC